MSDKEPGGTGDQAPGQSRAVPVPVSIQREVRGRKIGVPASNFDIGESVCYSHNWFERVDVEGIPHAQCLLCLHEKEEKTAAGKSWQKSRKKVDLLKVLQGTTKRKHPIIIFSNFILIVFSFFFSNVHASGGAPRVGL